MPSKFLDTASTTPTTNEAITPVTTYLDLEDYNSNDEDEEGFKPSIMRARKV